MSAFVFTTFGGRRFHEDRDCRSLESGRMLSDADCGCYEFCNHRLPTTHLPRKRAAIDAARAGFTACRVCVPPALALPTTGETHGHEPVPGEGWFGEVETICARCMHRGLWWGDPTYRMPVHVLWPCMSAVVLGLVPRGGDQ